MYKTGQHPIQKWLSLVMGNLHPVTQRYGLTLCSRADKGFRNRLDYAWTRNPIILSALAFLIGLGLWLQSGIFLVWVLVVVSPALLIFPKIYEERELELRFGDAYLIYKDKTPMLSPRRPRNRAKNKSFDK